MLPIRQRDASQEIDDKSLRNEKFLHNADFASFTPENYDMLKTMNDNQFQVQEHNSNRMQPSYQKNLTSLTSMSSVLSTNPLQNRQRTFFVPSAAGSHAASRLEFAYTAPPLMYTSAARSIASVPPNNFTLSTNTVTTTAIGGTLVNTTASTLGDQSISRNGNNNETPEIKDRVATNARRYGHLNNQETDDVTFHTVCPRPARRAVKRTYWSRRPKNARIVTRANRPRQNAKKAASWEVRAMKIHKWRSRYSYKNLRKYFFRDARFFLMKSSSSYTIALSKEMGMWSTLPQNEIVLNDAYRRCRNVILIFCVQELGRFEGFARMASESEHDVSSVHWDLSSGSDSSPYGGVFKLHFISRLPLPFSWTRYLFNSWDEGKRVNAGRDGQEIEPAVGEILCRLFPDDDNIHIISILRSLRRSKVRSRSPGDEYDRCGHHLMGHSSSYRSSPDSKGSPMDRHICRKHATKGRYYF